MFPSPSAHQLALEGFVKNDLSCKEAALTFSVPAEHKLQPAPCIQQGKVKEV